ncbi:hypothetical protein GCM10010411_95840 [Actinomadura fulvescens]|uniref:Uncharacterized protein n=1 Tax=Actinomadura fulvescens TaxID=46160 RepID=A0ABP6DFL3_9ACTN
MAAFNDLTLSPRVNLTAAYVPQGIGVTCSREPVNFPIAAPRDRTFGRGYLTAMRRSVRLDRHQTLKAAGQNR